MAGHPRSISSQLGRWKAATIVSVSLVAVLLLVIMSPLWLQLIAGLRVDWNLLSLVGQAFGGVSAVLSALALCGVAASLILQRSQARSVQEYATRERHFELVRLMLENPSWLYGPHVPQDLEKRQLWLHSNLWMTYWLTQWRLGLLAEKELRTLVSDLFFEEERRSWWSVVGRRWSFDGTERTGQFVRIVTEELDRATPRPEEPDLGPAADTEP